MSLLRITDVLQALDKILFEEIFVSQDKTCPGCKTGTLSLRIGKYGAFYSCDRYPDCSFVMKLNSNENPEDIAESMQQNSNDPLAYDQENMPIFVKKGPYGWYLQVGANPKDAGFKRVAIPASIKVQDIDQDTALRLVALPRLVGIDDQDNSIIAAIGRFGPYLKYRDKLISLPKDQNPFTIDVDKALQIIQNKEIKDREKELKVKSIKTDELEEKVSQAKQPSVKSSVKSVKTKITTDKSLGKVLKVDVDSKSKKIKKL